MSTLEITQRYGKALHPDGTPPPAAPAWIDEIDNPYLHGLFAPITHESESAELPVLEGEVPRDLFGAYFRNGPNNRFAPLNRYHWFDGDGMVHGVGSRTAGPATGAAGSRRGASRTKRRPARACGGACLGPSTSACRAVR